jgi:hypothetical protein
MNSKKAFDTTGKKPEKSKIITNLGNEYNVRVEYIIGVKCQNCNKYSTLRIPLGTEWREFVKNDVFCVHCMCKAYK